MIIGKGLIANRFREKFGQDSSVLIFASGVSDSKETDLQAYLREERMIFDAIKNYPDAIFIYFSTYSVIDPALQQQQYIIHKLKIEEYIKTHCKTWIIVRAGNIVGINGNRNTVFNYFKLSILENKLFEVWGGISRNLLDVDDLYTLLCRFIENKQLNKIVTIINPVPHAVEQIVNAIEFKLSIKANYNRVNKGSYLHPETSDVIELNAVCKIDFDAEKYLEKLLKKYL